MLLRSMQGISSVRSRASVPGAQVSLLLPKYGRRRKEASEAAELLKSGYSYLDVRTPEEFSGGHATGAVNVPLMLKTQEGMCPNQEFEQKVAEQFPDDQQQLVVGCKAGNRSARACAVLSKKYKNLVENAGGWDGWVEANLPVTQ